MNTLEEGRSSDHFKLVTDAVAELNNLPEITLATARLKFQEEVALHYVDFLLSTYKGRVESGTDLESMWLNHAQYLQDFGVKEREMQFILQLIVTELGKRIIRNEQKDPAVIDTSKNISGKINGIVGPNGK